MKGLKKAMPLDGFVGIFKTQTVRFHSNIGNYQCKTYGYGPFLEEFKSIFDW